MVVWQLRNFHAILNDMDINVAETHRLGIRAFLLFLSRHLKWPIIFFVVLAALWIERGVVPIDYQIWSDYALRVLFLCWLGLAVFMFLRSFFEYRGYSFQFDDEFFRVNRGYFLKQEMGIVYHQILHVTVRRGILDRAVGVAHLIIVTNVGGGNGAFSEIILPALDKTKARLVQRELLKKAHHHLARMPAGVVEKAAPSEAEASEETDEEEEEE